MTRLYWLCLGVLCVWRITHLLHAEDGPWKLLARARALLGSGLLGSVVDCFYCLSLWIAPAFAFVLGESLRERLLLWPALSGAAILVERAARANEIPPAIYTEELDDTRE